MGEGNRVSIDKLLKSKQTEHGSFKGNAILYKKLKKAFREETNMNKITDTMGYGLTMILTKICRISQVPTTIDHWRDIAGYATLVLKELETKPKKKTIKQIKDGKTTYQIPTKKK